MHLLIHPETTYRALLVASPTLYQELMDVIPEHLLSTKNQVFHFAPKQVFDKSQPKKCMLQLLDECIELFPKEIASFLSPANVC